MTVEGKVVPEVNEAEQFTLKLQDKQDIVKYLWNNEENIIEQRQNTDQVGQQFCTWLEDGH